MGWMKAEEVARLKRQVRELMEQDRQKLLMRFPFTGGIAMRLDLVPVHDCRLDTCSTDYENIYADVEFYSRLTADERLHVLAHEIWHCVLLHGLRRQHRDRLKFNYVADLEIYFLLCAEGLGIPFHLPYLESWEKERKSAEEMYELLPRLVSAMNNGGGFKKGHETANIKGAIEGRGFDKHAERIDGGEGVGTAARQLEGESTASESYFDEDYLPGWRMAAAEAMREKVVATAQQLERTRGTLPGHLQSIVESILKPEIRWQEILSQFVTSCYGGSRRWLPPNRRYVSQGLYLQSSRKEFLRAVVAIDTSSSTTGDLPRFFSELGSLLRTFGSYELTVIQADESVQSVQTFDDASPYDDSTTWKPKGHGGTDFRPVFDYVGMNSSGVPSCLIYITDGCGPAPSKAPPYPVLWVLTSDGKAPAEWGGVIKFSEPAKNSTH